MKTLPICVCLLVADTMFAQNARPLFNGKDMNGWEFLGRNGPVEPNGFKVEDGTLRTDVTKGMLWYTREKIANATLRVVYRMSNEKGNSGVFIRIPDVPKGEADAIHKGIEVQIDDRDNEWHCTGVLYSMTKALARPSKPPRQWNTMDIVLDGLRTIVKVNDTLVTDYDGVSPVPPKKESYEPERGPRPASGYIALQNHDTSAVVYFREISVLKK